MREDVLVAMLIFLSPIIVALLISIMYLMLLFGLWIFAYIDHLIWNKLFGGRE